MKTPSKKINLFYSTIFIMISFNYFSCKNLGNKFASFGDEEAIATITSDNENELAEAISILNNSGGTIYIDTPVINIEKTVITLTGEFPGGIIGKRQSSGEYPRINFSKTNAADGGIVIFGDNKFLEYIIVEGSFVFGINVFGNNNGFDHVISRYNSYSGFIVSGDFNTFDYCYSYRNCDTEVSVVNSDGFKISSEINTVFNYCFAWDNGNSGFNYVRELNSTDLSYLHSGSWNNGNVNIFTGRYDFDQGKPLDRNLRHIQKIIESDPGFVTNYYNRIYNINNAKIDDYSVTQWSVLVGPKMDGDGFTFGNNNSSQSIEVQRNSFYNVVFDQKTGGFVDHYIHRYNAYITDCVSFNNGINYKLPYYRLSKWSNNWSWNANNKDQLNGDVKAKIPANTDRAYKNFYSVRDVIIQSMDANTFPDKINFDKAIISLVE